MHFEDSGYASASSTPRFLFQPGGVSVSPNQWINYPSVSYHSCSFWVVCRVLLPTNLLKNKTIRMRIIASLKSADGVYPSGYFKVWQTGVVFPTRTELNNSKTSTYFYPKNGGYRYRIAEASADKYGNPSVITSIDWTGSFTAPDPTSDGADVPYGLFYVRFSVEEWDTNFLPSINISLITVTFL